MVISDLFFKLSNNPKLLIPIYKSQIINSISQILLCPYFIKFAISLNAPGIPAGSSLKKTRPV